MEISELKAGDEHYMAYVGPPTQYDFMGATQFRLLCSLGLRANHRMLDFGCGSLRAGRLFIAYLDEGKYFGIEPNKWLVEDGIKHHIGEDAIRIKKPRFDHNEEFSIEFEEKFDFIVAQSIFSHTGKDLIDVALGNFARAIEDDGMIVITFVESFYDSNESGWIYPGCVNFRNSSIKKFARKSGLFAKRIPWYHPRQTWYVLAKDKNRLPGYLMSRHLKGAVLFSSEYYESWKISQKLVRNIKEYARRIAPPSLKEMIRRRRTKE